MKIMLVNKFHWNKGGSETYYFELGKMLKEHGHDVAYFSMYDEKNIVTGDKEYFVKKFDSSSKNIFKAFNVIYSKNNKEKMIEALNEFKPDIVHVNLFQRQLTYSIIEACIELNIPVVQTAHDLQAVCPASAMLCNGKICSVCLEKSKYNCFKNKCIMNSRIKSLLTSIECSKYKRRNIYNMFNTIIVPSNFSGNMLKKGNISTKICKLSNFVNFDDFSNEKIRDDDYAFYFGRLSIEKGIMNLLMAFSNQPNGKLYIAGTGPEKDKIIDYINANNLNDRVKLLGFLNKDDIVKYISNSSFVVVPSICYDNCPYSVLESLVIGKPIIASRIGGIPELIDDNVNGFLYKFDDVDELSEKINKLFSNKNLRKKFSINSKERAIKNHSKEKYYDELMKIYKEAIGGN